MSETSIDLEHHTSETNVELENLFPKELPEVEVGPVYDESGFSLSEKVALRQAWGLIKPHQRRYGKEIYYSFLMNNYKVFDYFRRDGKFDMHRLHSHSLGLMHFIGTLIEQKDPFAFQAMINENYKKHKEANVDTEYMEMMLKDLIRFILEKLKDISSPTLERALQRLFEKFQKAYHKDDIVRGSGSLGNMSDNIPVPKAD